MRWMFLGRAAELPRGEPAVNSAFSFAGQYVPDDSRRVKIYSPRRFL